MVVLVVPAGDGRISVSALTLAAAATTASTAASTAAATAALAVVAVTLGFPGVYRGVVAGGAVDDCGNWSVLRGSTAIRSSSMVHSSIHINSVIAVVATLVMKPINDDKLLKYLQR